MSAKPKAKPKLWKVGYKFEVVEVHYAHTVVTGKSQAEAEWKFQRHHRHVHVLTRKAYEKAVARRDAHNRSLFA